MISHTSGWIVSQFQETLEAGRMIKKQMMIFSDNREADYLTIASWSAAIYLLESKSDDGLKNYSTLLFDAMLEIAELAIDYPFIENRAYLLADIAYDLSD